MTKSVPYVVTIYSRYCFLHYIMVQKPPFLRQRICAALRSGSPYSVGRRACASLLGWGLNGVVRQHAELPGAPVTDPNGAPVSVIRPGRIVRAGTGGAPITNAPRRVSHNVQLIYVHNGM